MDTRTRVGQCHSILTTPHTGMCPMVWSKSQVLEVDATSTLYVGMFEVKVVLTQHRYMCSEVTDDMVILPNVIYYQVLNE